MLDIIKVKFDWFSFNILSNDGAVSKSVLTESKGWEPHLVNFLKFNLDKTKTFIDIGSNFGWHSIIASKLCKKVFSFEPQKFLVNLQKQTIEDNLIDNIVIYNNALGDKIGKSAIRQIDYEYPQINTGDAWITSIGEEIEMITLDSLNINDIDLIKLDVQGYEKFVIEGSLKSIDRYKPIIVIELENFQLSKYGYDSKDIFTLMSKLGYYPFFLEYYYPCDHVFVHSDNLDTFRKKNEQYISKLNFNNELNNNLINGVKEKINYE